MRRWTQRLAAGLALLALGLPASAAVEPSPPALLLPHPVLAAADMRDLIDLSGPWTWSVDPYRDGLAGFHGDEAGTGHRRYDDVDVAEAMHSDPGALYEYDMDRSPRVTLPQSFVTHAPEMRYYQGLVWYQRHFTAQRRPGQRAFLRFGAVDFSAYVYLNGHRLGEHSGGFTPFAFEATKWLRDGDNRLTVGADSQRTDQDVPPVVTDWENYGGITRPVSLVYTPATYVDDAWAHLTRDGRLAASVRLDGENAAGRDVRIVIPALHFTLAGRTGPDGSWSGEAAAPASLRRWSPESPTVYDVRFEAGDDLLSDRVGFRTIEVNGEDIVLNGRPVFLRGVSIHAEEFGENPTRAITPAAARALLTEAKQGLHANFVRLAHYPHPETMTRMADELGLLVWSEIPVYWRVDFGRPETLAAARHMLAEEILRDRDRASIIIWSVGNETPVSPARNLFLATLADDARALDGSRLVSAALLTRRSQENGHPLMLIDDPLIPHLDVMAINTYNGWYGKDPLATLPGFVWRSEHHKPLIFSELGAEALAGFHDPKDMARFSEEYQAEYYRQTLAMAAKIPFLRGMSPWILKDFRTPRRQHPVYQQGWNRKGLESETGARKQAFAVLAEYYRSIEARAPAPAAAR